jgi:predicted  nucleic acid-binding Zn-ribbon protein
MIASKVSLTPYRDRVVVRWDWPPDVQEVYITHANDGFPKCPSEGSRVPAVHVKRNPNENNNEHSIVRSQQNEPLFVAIWLVSGGRATGEGLFATTCPSVTLRWKVEQTRIKAWIDSGRMASMESIPSACIPDFHLIHLQDNQRRVIAAVTADQARRGETIIVQSMPKSGMLLLEPQHLECRNWVHIEPPLISLSAAAPSERLFDILLSASSASVESRRAAIDQARQIVDGIDQAECDSTLRRLIERSGQPPAYYAAVLEAFRFTLEMLEALYAKPPTETVARTAIMDAVRALHREAPDDEDAVALLWRMVKDNNFLADAPRLDLLRYLMPSAAWDRLHSLLNDKQFPNQLKQKIVEYLGSALNAEQAWSKEEAILEKLQSIAADVNLDAELRLSSVTVMAAWAQKRSLKPYRTLDGEQSLKSDDLQHQRECWAYRAAGRIAGLDSLFNRLSASDLVKLTNLGRSGNPTLASAVYRRLKQLPPADMRNDLMGLLPLFRDTRSSDPQLLSWLMERVRDAELTVEVRALCLDVLIVTPIEDPTVITSLTNLAVALLQRDMPSALRQRALALIERHHLGDAARHLVDILFNESDLRSAAVAAWQAAPNTAALEEYLSRLHRAAYIPMSAQELVDAVRLPQLSEAVNWADAIARQKQAQSEYDALTGRLKDLCSTYNLPEIAVLTTAALRNLHDNLEDQRSAAAAELASLNNQRSSYAQRLSELAADQTSIKITIGGLKSQLANADTNKRTLKQALDDTKKRIKKLEANLNNIQGMREGTQEARAESARLQEELKRARADAERLETEVNSASTHRSTLETMLKGEEEKLGFSERDQRAVEAAVERLDAEIAAAQARAAKLAEALQGLNAIIQAFTNAQNEITQANQAAAEARRRWQAAAQEAAAAACSWIAQQRHARVRGIEELRAKLAPQPMQVRGRN